MAETIIDSIIKTINSIDWIIFFIGWIIGLFGGIPAIRKYLTKKPRFKITDVSMNLTPRDKREPRLDVDFKVWNGKSKLIKIITSDALSVDITAISITAEMEAIEPTTSRETAPIIPVGRFHTSKHILNVLKPLDAVYVRVKCSETVLRKNFKINDYVKSG